MSQYMPKDGFNWYKEDLSVENILNLLDGMDETSEVGWALEVDVSYPDSLHDDHNDLPYLPEKITPPGSKIKKLVANLHSKHKYIVHYMALKQALKAGLILDKMPNDNSSPIFSPNMELSPVPDYAYEVQHDHQQGEMINMFNFETQSGDSGYNTQRYGIFSPLSHMEIEPQYVIGLYDDDEPLPVILSPDLVEFFLQPGGEHSSKPQQNILQQDFLSPDMFGPSQQYNISITAPGQNSESEGEISQSILAPQRNRRKLRPKESDEETWINDGYDEALFNLMVKNNI
ncbi:uncharacterized protein LOC132923765 isoform X2 [Rhopalosiphum padi]|nr:uncharacterized protein LOC132923765 isoform X2 [Rhopalosiphum padi]